MKSITLKNGMQVRVSPEDHDRLSKHVWSQFKNGRVYRRELIPRELRRKKMYRTLLLHREVMEVEDARKVIFRDGDPTNCVRENLVVTGPRFQPRQRVKRGGSSDFRGVGWNKAKGMWQSFIRVNGKLKHLGFFPAGEDGEKLAAHAYDDAALEQFGDLAILNFPRVGGRKRAAVEAPEPRPAAAEARKPRLVASAAARPEPVAAKEPASGKGAVEDLYEKAPHDLTPEEMEAMKARFLGERYRAKMRRVG